MARDSSGTYTRVSGAAPSTNSVSSSAKFNSEMADITTELTDSLSRSNKGAMLADLNHGAFSAIFTERVAPSSPASDKIALYAADNGGTTTLYAKDSAGTVTNLMAAGVGGTTGGTDNALLRANGTGGAAAQGSSLIVADDGSIVAPEMSAPSTPGAATVVLYPKSDGMFYEKDDAGTERRLNNIGKHTIGIQAGSLIPATTSGCASLAQAETSSNKINYKYLAYDATSDESAWFWMPTPKSYNASTLTARVVWTHPATATNFGVVWQIAILSLSDDDAIDTAAGTAINVTDTGGTTQDFYMSPAFAAITASNAPAKQDWLAVRVTRLASNGSDTLAVDAHLIGVELYYTTDAATDD